MSETLNIAIIGLGHLHPRAYMPLWEACVHTNVVAACDGDKALVEAFCKDFSLRGYTRLDALLAAEAIDLAAIFLPHNECADAGIACAKRGIHLMIEKPVSDKVTGAEALAAAAEEAGVKVTTGYCWRYHPVIVAMREAIADGRIGKVVSVEARLAAGRVERYVRGNSEWMLQKARAGGGPMYNLGVHWLDVLCHVLQDKITSVCAVNSKASDAYDIEDCSVAMLRFASGPIGVLSTSYIVPDCFPNGRDLYLGIKGTQGAVAFAPGYEGEQGSSGAGQTDVLELYSDHEKARGASVRRMAFQLDSVAGYSGYMGKALVEEFIDAILTDQEPPITIRQAIDVLRVVEAIYESDKKKEWIEVTQ
jgi:predicted dehydrogenase